MSRSKAKGTKESLADRLWRRTAKDDGCWEWQGYLHPHGYGQIGYGRGAIYTHKAAWLVTHGTIPEGIFVCHKCDNRKCVRPDHLFLGTHQDNMRDMKLKGRGRGAKGEASGNVKLTDAQVDEIRRRYSPGGRVHPRSDRGRDSASSLASEFGVSKVYINQLGRGKWRTSE